MNENEINLDKFINDVGDKAFRTLRKDFHYLSTDDLRDIFNDSFMALYENLSNKKFDNSKGATLSTYFISICRNQARKFLRERSRIVSIGEEGILERRREGNDKEHGEIPFEEIENVRRQENYDQEKITELLNFGNEIDEEGEINHDILNGILQDLPYPCNNIIPLWFYDNLHLQEIADEFGYSSARCVETTKQRCIERLKEKFKDERRRFDESR